MNKKDKLKTSESIGISKAAQEKLRKGLQEVEHFNIFLSGVRLTLNVPKGWLFDPRGMMFRAPEGKKENVDEREE